MSKMEGLRALREARYAERRSRGNPAAAPTDAASGVARAPQSTAARKPQPRPEPADSGEPGSGPADAGLCGHRAISGRTCTRERGHAAKSHRYS